MRPDPVAEYLAKGGVIKRCPTVACLPTAADYTTPEQQRQLAQHEAEREARRAQMSRWQLLFGRRMGLR